MDYIMVFITASGKKEAEDISNTLLDNRAAACINIIDNISSNFWWNGQKDHIKECLLIVKTKQALLNNVVNAVKSIHSYEVPEIIAIPIIGGYDKYFDWVNKETS